MDCLINQTEPTQQDRIDLAISPVSQSTELKIHLTVHAFSELGTGRTVHPTALNHVQKSVTLSMDIYIYRYYVSQINLTKAFDRMNRGSIGGSCKLCC